jgi:3-hydroxybutyryl-CoA dehydrogenase
MKIVVITDEGLKAELLEQGQTPASETEWINVIPEAGHADACIDLLFDGSPERVTSLAALQPALIIVNAVSTTLDELPAGFIRINGWSSFLKRNVVEASCNDAEIKNKASTIFGSFNKTTEWVADIPGFIAARVISMIINEAYFTLEEEVSTKEEIDTAMKLGTNYPYGPFEWSRLIGPANIHTLLEKMATVNERYKPCALLTKEATSA